MVPISQNLKLGVKWSVFSDMVTYIRGCVFTVQLRDKVTRVSTSHAGVTICTCDCSTPPSPVARKFSVLCLLHVRECLAELEFCGSGTSFGQLPSENSGGAASERGWRVRLQTEC